MRAKIVVLTNIPTPYRMPLFERLSRYYGGDFSVVYCSDREPGRSWVFSDYTFRTIFLSEGRKYNESREKVLHLQWNVISVLFRLRPEVMVLAGLGPTFLFGLIFGLFFRVRMVYWTDGTIHTESKLSIFHGISRRFFFRFFKAFIGASEKSMLLFDRYGIKRSKMFRSPLTPNISVRENAIDYSSRYYDVIFCGQLIDRKMPDFFLEVCAGLAETRPGLRVLIVGDGVKRESLERKAKEIPAEIVFAGHVPPEKLADHYANSRIMLFTTYDDAWGLVANEALSCGTPVLISREAGAADELILDGVNGYVLDNRRADWVNSAASLLSQEEWRKFSREALKSVDGLDVDQAVRPFTQAVAYADEWR